MQDQHKWSPFDPRWYQLAFERYISTAEELFNTDTIKQQGYYLPDADGSKSSVFRNNAVTNNSFNEQKLRETLEDIYLNDSNRLKAANRDNVHTYQWHGKMSDMKVQSNIGVCTFVIPTECFIPQEDRDVYKMSQFYRKWVSIQDILNNSNVFHWYCMLFINRRIYSEYELRIDDHETTIRFTFEPHWLKYDYPVDIYKIDTGAQCRVLISRELCENQWGWRMPVSHITNQQVLNSDRIIVAFNRIRDPNIRTQAATAVEVLGDNLEFLRIQDGYVDLSNISEFNRMYIKSELTEWLWMSIIVPKYMHEYPIILPTDVIYRSYTPSYKKVAIAEGDFLQHVKVDEDQHRQVYADVNPDSDGSNRWSQMIRPMVLQDAYDGNFDDPYIDFLDELGNLRKLTVQGADFVEEFRFALLGGLDEGTYNYHLDRIQEIMRKIHDVHNGFLDRLLIEYDQSYEGIYEKFLGIMDIVRKEGPTCDRFTVNSKSAINFWNDVSPLIHIPRSLVDKYNVAEVINAVRHQTSIWEDSDRYQHQNRFQRPIDPNDFWMFEYDIVDHVWRPAVLDVEHHYPDVYTFKDPTETTPSLNRVFKAFFFYSDNINPRELTRDFQRPGPSWDEDITKYHINPMGSYHDIFMEKFYWMGIKAIYSGIMHTESRWEALEYVMDNPEYGRFNELFMKSSDPYFERSLAGYLQSENFGFPFDENVNKMKQAINEKLLDHRTLVNFEMYLDKTWAPSYFDTVLKIQDIDHTYNTRIIKRPSRTFDFDRIIPIFSGVQAELYEVIRYVCEELDWILGKLSTEPYDLVVDNFTGMRQNIVDLTNWVETMLKLTNDLDPQTYSTDEINEIIHNIEQYLNGIDQLYEHTDHVYQDSSTKKQYEKKQDLLDHAREVAYGLTPYIDRVLAIIAEFDMDLFMRASNDLRTYFDYRKENENDNSLLGWINRFNDPWSVDVKEKRDTVFQQTAILFGKFDPLKPYTPDEIQYFINRVDDCIGGVHALTVSIREFYRVKRLDVDQIIIDRLDFTDENLRKLRNDLQKYMDARAVLQKQLDVILEDTNKLNIIASSDVERQYVTDCETASDQLMSSLSYIAGEGDRKKAYQSYDNLVDTLNRWNDFVLTETEVFNRILNLVQPPVEFINDINKKRSMLEAIIAYMRSAGLGHEEDSASPNYNEVYAAGQVAIQTGGFNHKVGDRVFAPNLDSFQITEVNDTVQSATGVQQLNYRNTTFRNPSWQRHSYDSISDGAGLGITLNPTVVNTIPIVNDHLTSVLLSRAINIVKVTAPYIDTPNSYANTGLYQSRDKANEWNAQWNEFCSNFSGNISDGMMNKMTRIHDIMDDLSHIIDLYGEYRAKIDVGIVVIEFERCLTDYKIDNKEFLTAYRKLLNYYGNGSSWDDMDEMGALITETFGALMAYMHHGHPINEIEDVEESVDRVMTMFDDLPTHRDELSTIVDRLAEIIDEPVNEIVHKWYRIDNVMIARGGTGYRIGDIIKIVPDKQQNETGEPIDDGWDIIQNDVILLQVVDVNGGAVSAVTTFMEYAIPYQIRGIRTTDALVGTGAGLVVDVYSHQVDERDNTVFTKTNSQAVSNRNDNDLVAFQFQNIYDLPITYEVFIGGRNITDFIQRHEEKGLNGEPGAVDVLYLRASQLNSLRNITFHIDAEDYPMYRVNNIDIVDPGAGYYAGQEVFVDTNNIALRLKVAELVFGPTKGIARLEIAGGNLSKDENPSATGCGIIEDDMNNIDDEYHDVDRNTTFLYPDVDPKEDITTGDPDYGWYAGSRIDNSQHPMTDERVWNGIMQPIPTMDPQLPDDRRIPPDVNPKGEFQGIVDINLHNTYTIDETWSMEVTTIDDLPHTDEEWKDGKLGALIAVTNDEKHDGHRTLYRVRTFSALGEFVYELVRYIDREWNQISVDWMNCDWYPDIPEMSAMYPTAKSASTFANAIWEIRCGKHKQKNQPSRIGHTTYIKDLTIDDLSLFNWTTMQWEDLHDESKWRLDVVDDYEKQQWGFTLTCLQEEPYSYDVTLFLNKTGDVLKRCVPLRRNAIVNIDAAIAYEVHQAAQDIELDIGNTIRIRKLFPYEQKESYTIGKSTLGEDLGNEMVFRLARYKHYRNEINLQDIVLYNRTTDQFESVMDHDLFEVCIMDPKAKPRGFEMQSKVGSITIRDSGSGFVSGEAWAYDPTGTIGVFGEVRAKFPGDGHVIEFIPLYTVGMPTESTDVYMTITQGDGRAKATAVVHFTTEKVNVDGDGYIHDVRNPYAPITYGFKIIVKYQLDSSVEYDVIINKNPKVWAYSSDKNEMAPEIIINDVPVPANRMYLMNNAGRLPLVNPASNQRTMDVTTTESGMSIKLNQMYRRYDRLEVHSVPYPMRSVYVQRRIPSHGYINLDGKINKPLNKKFFEFWVNGKLVYDEVTIISPTKIIMHGLTSLRNFEIIEVNRDPNEFFSDVFHGAAKTNTGTMRPKWDYTTYLDAVLEGKLDENYTEEEQEYLLTPVWKQVDTTHPEFKHYPPNVDTDDDILLGIKPGEGIGDITNPPFQSFVLDGPTIEGVGLGGSLQFSDFGFTPITSEEILAITAEIWGKELAEDPYFPPLNIISDDVWYGRAVAPYDEFGIRVHNLNDAKYVVSSRNQIMVDKTSGIAKIIQSNKKYDLT